jgi:hypothetical protein
MQNTITVSTLSFNVAKKQRPFSNNFVQNSARIVQHEGGDEVHAYITCTANSQEPGRIYKCAYSMQGELLACCTVN